MCNKAKRYYNLGDCNIILGGNLEFKIMIRIVDTTSFVIRVNSVHNFRYDYSKCIYKNNKSKIIITCKEHGDFVQLAANHIRGKGCKICGISKSSKSKQKKTETFIYQANLIHKNRYDYSLSEYNGAFKKLTIICKNHGSFDQEAKSHLQGFNCKKCNIENQCFTLNYFIENANIIHNSKYDYFNVIYKNILTPVKINCASHGVFYQTPQNHLIGQGCKKCANEKMMIDPFEFIKICNQIHKNKYNYNLVNYKGCLEKIKIICIKHGEFIQEARVHLTGSGCPNCSNIISKKETDWLNFLKIKSVNRSKTLIINNKVFKVDAINKSRKIIYEFYGDYWHGNPFKYSSELINKSSKKTFGELYQRTMIREQLLKEAGYKLVIMWESDWNKIIKGQNK